MFHRGLARIILNMVKQTCLKPHNLSFQTKHAFGGKCRLPILFKTTATKNPAVIDVFTDNIYNNIHEPEKSPCQKMNVWRCSEFV